MSRQPPVDQGREAGRVGAWEHLEVSAPEPGDTEGVAARLGALLHPGDLVALEGPLGAGKTTFVRGMAVGRGVDGALVRSPTFVLHHVYGSPPRLHHVDLFRLGPGAAITLLDLDSLLETAPVAVEWGGFADLDPWQPLRLSIDIEEGSCRRIAALRSGVAPERLLAAWRVAIEGGSNPSMALGTAPPSGARGLTPPAAPVDAGPPRGSATSTDARLPPRRARRRRGKGLVP